MNQRHMYDVNRSLAVSASAGSGKTFVLTARIVALLLAGAKPSDILVVTFTNLAAADIRRRLLERVAALAGGDEEDTALFSSLLSEPAGHLQERARALREELITKFSLLQVSTVDSFFTRILKCFPRETGIIQDIAIVDEIAREGLCREAFERFYRSLRMDTALMDRVFAFITHYRDSTLSPDNAMQEVYRSIESKRHSLKETELIEKRGQRAYQEFIRKREMFFSEEMHAGIEFLTGSLSRYIRGKGRDRNSASFLRELNLFLRQGSVDALAGLTAFKQENVSYIGKVCASLPEEDALRFMRTLSRIRENLRLYLQAQMQYYLCTWFEIHRRIDAAYRALKETGQFIDFTDIEEHARRFLSLLPDFDYLSYRIGSELRHILIDEFQDTSELQWEALAPLVRGSLARGGSFFYVGDVKQSIYRWRGGQPHLFDLVAEELKLEQGSLLFSYRQGRVLVDFINGVFSHISSLFHPSYPYELQQIPPEKEDAMSGYVSVTEVEEKDTLLQEVTDSIRELNSRGVAFDDIAILCRKNSDIEELEKHLRGNRIPCRAAGKSRLFQDYSILDMLGVMSFALDPEEEIHLAGLLRSPLFRWSYEELQKIRGEGGRLSLERIRDIDPAVYGKLASIVGRARFLSPAGFLRVVYQELNVLACYQEKREPLLKLYELAYTFENSSDSLLLADFVEYLHENSASLTLELSDEHGVLLLTVHAAKGLEFHTVIVPFLNQPFSYRLDGSILFRRQRGGGIASPMIARSLYRDYLSKSEEIETLFRITDKEYKTDELNILYVSLTRARENLLIFPLKKGEKETVGNVLIQSIDPSLGERKALFSWEKGTLSRASHETTAEVRELRMLCMYEEAEAEASLEVPVLGEGEAVLFPPGTPTGIPRDRYEWFYGEDFRARRTGLLKGLIFHRALFHIHREEEDEERILRAISNALAFEGRGFSRAERDDAVREAHSALEQVLSDDRISHFFTPSAIVEGLFVSREYPNLLGRIDRVLVGDEVQVLDFKTNRIHDDQHLTGLVSLYRRQVVSYCRSLERMYPQKKVTGFLYFTGAEQEKRLVEVY